jgi:CheY-like chemotaxis protein
MVRSEPTVYQCAGESISSPLVLIVDPDEDSRTILSGILRANYYRTVEASDVGEAWCVLERHAVALILLEAFGLDCTPSMQERIHELPSPPPILAVTTQDEREGYDFYLRKPCTPQQLLREVRKVITARTIA